MTTDWNRAACRDEDPETFFPVGKSGPALLQIEQAKAVCRRCPITADCLDYANRLGFIYGIWAGLTEDERHPRPVVKAAAEPAVPPLTGTLREEIRRLIRAHISNDEIRRRTGLSHHELRAVKRQLAVEQYDADEADALT